MIQAMSWAEFSSLFGKMMGGLWVTLAVFGLTLLFSLPLGLLIALGRLIKNKIILHTVSPAFLNDNTISFCWQ